MADGICDVCNVRPATVRARVSSNGKSEILELCDVDYRRLARQQQRPSSPLESLFGGRGSLFDDFFSDDFFGGRSGRGDDAEPPAPSGTRRRIHPGRVRARPRTRPRHRRSTESLSAHAEEILQGAARRAAELGRSEVDTEHLLYALTESDVVRTILDQFKVSLDDLRRQLEQERPPRRPPADDETRRDRRLAAGQGRAGTGLRGLARVRPFLCRPRAPPDRPRRGGGGRRRRRAAPLRAHPAGDPPAGHQGGRPRRRGRPRRDAHQHAEPRQILARPDEARARGQARPGDRPREARSRPRSRCWPGARRTTRC